MSASARRRRPFLDVDRPLCFAHRGGGALFPENTLTAFQGALDLGLGFVETDIHATRDGILVVHHDETVDRTTDGTGRIADLRYAEIRRLDAGYHFSPEGGGFPYRGKGVYVPTFSELLDLSPTARINVDLKSKGRAAAQRLWEIIDGRGAHDRVLVASEDDRQLRRFRRYSLERVATSASRREALEFFLASRIGGDRFLPVKFDALQIPPRYVGVTTVDRRLVHAAHRHGLHVHVWTIDQPWEMRRLLNLGVDGIISDRPDRLVSLEGARLGPF